MIKKLFFIILLTSCASSNSVMKLDSKKIDFKDDLSFEDFKVLLIQYAKTSPYPDINK
jgi:hypothetical protein